MFFVMLISFFALFSIYLHLLVATGQSKFTPSCMAMLASLDSPDAGVALCLLHRQGSPYTALQSDLKLKLHRYFKGEALILIHIAA